MHRGFLQLPSYRLTALPPYCPYRRTAAGLDGGNGRGHLGRMLNRLEASLADRYRVEGLLVDKEP